MEIMQHVFKMQQISLFHKGVFLCSFIYVALWNINWINYIPQKVQREHTTTIYYPTVCSLHVLWMFERYTHFL